MLDFNPENESRRSGVNKSMQAKKKKKSVKKSPI